MPSSRKSTLRLFLVGLLLMTCIFGVLYHPYLFGGHLYAYEDIGSDTIHQYLPTYAFELEQLRRGGDGYSLMAGLGKYSAGLLTKYLNPANLPLLLFGAEHLHMGILVSTYLRYGLILLFSLLYFLRLLKEPRAALISALLWTFSGFNVLWGQHYHFLTAMAYFTACMYTFQLYLEEDRKGILVAAALALLLGTSYYFTYISLWFFAVYGVFYLISQRRPALYILRRVGLFALLAVLSALMSVSGWLPSVLSFLESSRTQQVSETLSGSGLFYTGKTLLSFCARLLSVNLLGIADDYAGVSNYYEAPALCVSVLFLFALCYLLLSRHWKKTLALFLGCGVLLCMPLTSRLLVFTEASHRWTYVLSFLQALTVGFAVKTWLTEPLSAKRSLPALLLADGLLALLTGGLLIYHHSVTPWLSKTGCAVLLFTVTAYHLAFLLMGRTRRWAVLLVLVALELAAVNYPTVNHRDTVSLSQWRTSLYNDGTEKALAWLARHDDSPYRVNKTYYSVSMADSLAQGYAGMGVYSSTNSAHLLTLAEGWGYEAGNWLSFHGTDWLANDLLGVKYVLTPDTEDYSETMSLVYEESGIRVWENTDWSGFGYLCTDEIADPASADYGRHQLASMLTRSYYRTGNTNAPAVNAGVSRIDLLTRLEGSYDCAVTATETGLTVESTGTDPQLYFSIPAMAETLAVEVLLEMEASDAGVVQLFTATETEGYRDSCSYATTYSSGTLRRQFLLTPEAAVLVRLDPADTQGKTLRIRALEVVLTDPQLLLAQRQAQRSSVTAFAQQASTFTGTVSNPAGQDAMLCIPLIYSRFWQARVDGRPVAVENINGGLVGIPIPTGDHSFSLTYSDSLFTAAKWVSLLSLALYFALLWLGFYKKRQKNPV